MDIDLMQKLGNMDQIAGIRELKNNIGNGREIRILEIYNAAGLRFTVLPDHCMDIYDFSYKGYNFSFHSKNGLTADRNPTETDFFHQWSGGMMLTCGLANVGNACQDNGQHPIHGRIGNTAAKHICVNEYWQGNKYILSASGEMWETQLYGRQISLHRTLSLGLFDKTVEITDTICNHEKNDEEFMLLYHINYGYPLLDQFSIFFCSPATTKAKNKYSKDFVQMAKPDTQPYHQLYLHTPSGRIGRAAIVNPKDQLAGYVEFDTTHLPYLCEWKHMASHDYVVALEPCNCIGLGRVKERENGTLKILPAYSTITHKFFLGVLDGEKEIQKFIKTCK